jgi:hypothetical protein
VYSEPCSCECCDVDPGYHLPSHWGAEHYDEMMKPSRHGWNGGGNDPYQADRQGQAQMEYHLL